MKGIRKDPNRFLFPESGNSLPSSLGSHSANGGAAASPLLNKRFTLPFLAVLAALALGLLFLLPGGLIQAQAQDSATIEYAEGGMDPVVTLTATDPEMDTITWSVTGGTDQTLFAIDEDDGVLTFNTPPDYEGDGTDNDHEVVVTATDTADPANTDTFTVNVEVTDVEEDGVVTWTIDPDGDGALVATTVNGGMPILQFQPGAVLTASVTDGDVSGG